MKYLAIGTRSALATLFALALVFGTTIEHAASQQAAEDERTPEVKKFVEHYFSTWSNVEMDAYADCFLNEAVVQFIDPRGQLHSQTKKTFIAEQRAVQARNPGKEVPETIEITFEPNLARAVVYWKLTMRGRVDYGYDHFTLARQQGKWKIVNLVFYKSDPPE